MTEKVRFEEFAVDGENFIYIDFSGIKSNEEFLEQARMIEPVVAKYPPNSLYTITNVQNTRIDSKSKEYVAKYMEHNKPYVKRGAVIGIDGIIKVLGNAIFSLSRRENLVFAYTKEQAIELLLGRE